MSEIISYNQELGDWIIDTDPGIDDAFALTFAFNFIKENLKLISIESGNVGYQQCIDNAKKLCVMNNKSYKISNGKGLTLSTFSLKCFSGIHGSDGFFDFSEYNELIEKYDNSNMCKQHSAIEIIKLCNEYNNLNKKINILTLGPLTNLALAYMLDPTIVNKINKVVIMGGAYLDTGNISPSGEFNFACDNVSAKIVLDSFHNLTVYCWEPSLKHLVYPEDIKVHNKEEKSIFIDKVVKKKMEWNQGGIYADYGAAVAAFYPNSITKSEFLFCDVIIDSSKCKQSRFVVSRQNYFANKNKRKVEVVYDLDINLFHKFANQMLEQ